MSDHAFVFTMEECAELQRKAHARGVASAATDADRDRIDAERYRALRSGMILGLTEDNNLVLSVDIAGPDEELDDIEHPMTERSAPFLTEKERSDLNGDRGDSAGYVRGDDAVDRAADFVRAERAK